MARSISEARALAPARPWLAPPGLFAGALAFYAINLDRPPEFDELYHVLGARGYLEHGEPRIAEGVYTRTALFTAFIALLFDIFGESIVVARLPAVVSGALLAACLFAWTRAPDPDHVIAWSDGAARISSVQGDAIGSNEPENDKPRL